MEAKMLPHNLESERELLGSLMKNNSFILDAIQILTPNDFYETKHKKIYEGIIELFKENTTVDLVTVATKLSTSLKYIGGITYISELFGCAMAVGSKAHIDIIKQCSIRRMIIHQCNVMSNSAYTDVNPKDIINKFENEMLDISTEGSQILTAGEVMAKTLNFVEENYRNGGGIIGMSCGLKTIDNATDGFIKKDVVVIAARPSMGKTLFAMAIADGLSKENKVALFELEMGEEALGVRQLAAKSMINGVKLRRGDLNDKEWSDISNAAQNIATRKLWIDTTSSQTIFDIKAKVKKLKMQNGLDCVIIDHIGLLEETNKNNMNRNLHIAEITRQAKIMAKDLDINVILLSQLSRAPEQRADHRPIMSDLRESGNIEQDADLVMFLYRDEYYDAETEDKNILEVGITKQRNGKTGSLNMFIDLGIQVIADLDRSGR